MRRGRVPVVLALKIRPAIGGQSFSAIESCGRSDPCGEQLGVVVSVACVLILVLVLVLVRNLPGGRMCEWLNARVKA
jgi:hypothetical protein